VRAEPSVATLDEASASRLLPIRDPNGHKGTFGTLLCICGSLDYAGAALLSTLSGARGGAGLVALAVPASLQQLFSGRIPEVVTMGLPETADGTDVDSERSLIAVQGREAEALLIGPGLRESEGYRWLLIGLLQEQGVPMVVDGGALNLLARTDQWWKSVLRACVLTPHPGEFGRLTDDAVGSGDGERARRCVAAAQWFGQVVVLKGARTVIAAPDGRVAVAPFANPALATAGSGDVLAGLIGALLAQGVEPFGAACLGVFMHGMAGERLAARLGDAGLVASDLPYEIALVRHDLAAARSG
jgi:NAD(P)H-hydrate epimerase